MNQSSETPQEFAITSNSARWYRKWIMHFPDSTQSARKSIFFKDESADKMSTVKHNFQAW